ncbi:MAG: flagellar hook-basal body protein [bacterium]
MLDRLALTGHTMITRMAQLEAITNNLANISTNGYKREELFVNELKKQVSVLNESDFTANQHIPEAGANIDFSQGALERTAGPLDIAISGDGLFTVETQNGEAYTRDGRFTLNQDGILTTFDGHPVLGEGGPVEINLQENAANEILINERGEILLAGNIVESLKIVSNEKAEDFIKIGGNLFQLRPGAEALPVENPVVKQGFLENSNVDSVREMVAMIELMHHYEVAQKMIRSQDGLLNRAVNDIGRVG